MNWKAKTESSFLKKRSKKLLSVGFGPSGKARRRVQEFFGSFFQKRTAFFTYWCRWLILRRSRVVEVVD
jgi:hypothetical protein